MTPLLHARTRLQLQYYLNKPAHALLIKGPESIGKFFIASWISNQLKLRSEVITVVDKKNNISIDQVRNIYRLTRTGEPMVVIVKDAHLMGIPAQNAFLKLLEEPPTGVKFILTAISQEQSLLPTITSRCVSVEVLKPSRTELLKLAQTASKLSPSQLETLLYTTQGLPAKFLQSAHNSDMYNLHINNVKKAKQFYQLKTYERHQMLIEHNYDKIWAEELIDLLSVVLLALLKPNVTTPTSLIRLSTQSKLLESVRSSFSASVNPKIHLTRLAEEL